jgi:hypothetical protein
MKRDEVIDVVKQELEYQSSLEDCENSHIVSTINMGGILTAIQHNLTKAQAEWYYEKEPYAKTSDLLRKIAALCIKAGELYNMTKRYEHGNKD